MDVLSLFRYPIIQAPMAGGATTPQLVAAVSNAGALGSFAASLLSPASIDKQVAEIRSLTDRPFLVNLFVQPAPHPSGDEIERGKALLRPLMRRLGLDELPTPSKWCEDFDAQFEAVLRLKPAVVSFTFGIVSSAQVERLHAAGIAVVGTATTVEEAVAWESIGADAVVASSVEGGGHRGTFLGKQEDAFVPGDQLWTAAALAVAIPVVAAGGIMDGSDICKALQSGARAVQMGTAFLACDETDIDPLYKQRILTASGQPTRLTRAFTGRYARGIENEFMRVMEPVQNEVPAYPVQNALTRSIRAEAAAQGDTEMMSLWAGTGVARCRAMPAGELVRVLVEELQLAGPCLSDSQWG